MKKIVFEGIVNDAKYDNVDDYNKAVQEAINGGLNVKASSKTEIIDVPDENENAKKSDPKFEIDIKNMMSKTPEELQVMLDQFKLASNRYKKQALVIIKSTKDLASRQMNTLAHDIDVLDTRAAEIQDQVDKLDEQYDKITEKADQLEEQRDKLSMIVECLDDIIKGNDNQKTNDDMSEMTKLWKTLFGA